MINTIAQFRRVNAAVLAAQCLAVEPLHEEVERKELALTLKRVAPALKISGTSYHILDILLGLVRREDLRAGGRPLVAISNEKLASYTMRSTRTVSRCIKRLVEVGILAYADSPNGRRFVRRDRSGAIDYGYGLDLTPACCRLAELQNLASEYQERLKLEKQAKRTITSKARAARDMAALLGEEAEALLSRIEKLVEAPMDLISKAEAIEATYNEMLDIEVNMSSLGDINGVAISNTTQSHLNNFVVDERNGSNEPYIENHTDNDCYRNVELALEKQPEATSSQHQDNFPSRITSNADSISMSSSALAGVSIDLINQGCKNVSELLHVEFSSWNSLLDSTEHLRHLIGLSEAGWKAGCSAQGKYLASACLVVVAEKALRDPEAITRPGGYFRAMIDRANDSKLNLQKSVFGLAQG